LIGTVSVEKSELLSAFLESENITHTVLNAKNHEREGDIVAGAGSIGCVTVATNMAGRGVDIKLGGKNATKEDQEKVKDLGGLFVIGTERHEARRIDNQLRGRSGRQGDPGETQFYVSMEDDLMRVFGSDGMKKMMGRFGIPEDEPITNGIISRGLENAQKKIEGFNFDARKHTLEYDNVLNHQRNIIYDRRSRVLHGDREFIKEYLTSAGIEGFEELISEKIVKFGEDDFFENARKIILYLTDVSWVEHLETMDYTRSSVNLRAYGQHDPLIEYKKEGIRLFKDMENLIKSQTYELIKNMEKQANKEPETITVTPNFAVNTTDFANVGKNDLCPCGSGKKFKKCHGKEE
jgi:preprotein translocase subunit SecA